MSSAERPDLSSHACTGALAKLIDDDYLMDTSNWTTDDLAAAILLARWMQSRNAATGARNRGYIQGM